MAMINHLFAKIYNGSAVDTKVIICEVDSLNTRVSFFDPHDRVNQNIITDGNYRNLSARAPSQLIR
jgi:hypothetical protein